MIDTSVSEKIIHIYKTLKNLEKGNFTLNQQNNNNNTHIKDREELLHHATLREYHTTMWFEPTKPSLQGMKIQPTSSIFSS